MGNLIDFVNAGGNVLVTASNEVSDAIRDFSYEFSVDFKSSVNDPFDKESTKESLVKGYLLTDTKHVVDSVRVPLYFSASGIGHALSGRNNLIKTLVAASDSAFIQEGKKVNEKSFIGSAVSLISYFEALNNARVIFAGSHLLFSDS